jgi:type II secretory pathway pseudopilin PulG
MMKSVAMRMLRSERGVSLMETLVALFILSVVGVAVIAGVYTTVLSNETARTKITAESLARTELEYVSSQPISKDWTSYTLTSPTIYPTYPAGWDPAHTMPQGYSGYSIKVTLIGTETGSDGKKSSKQKITADVYYNVTTKVFSMSTYLAERK